MDRVFQVIGLLVGIPFMAGWLVLIGPFYLVGLIINRVVEGYD